ncbi:MAG: hypothetical protein LBU89_06290 [Fibromonadaceae bacterium]|nr:hypothetical protein [Fibromonadaceae bacterium]
MSNEALLFPTYFFEGELFCRICAQIRKFEISSQEKYDKHYGKCDIPPNKPLFCQCVECDSTVIYATHEFAELQEEPMLGLCKIWGMANLEAGDAVFHPTEGLCTVESVNRFSNSLPEITLRDKNKKKIEAKLDIQTQSKNNDFYRIFPQNAASARIGDQIYHTETKLFGKVVGLEFNGEQAIFVKFDDGKIERCCFEKDRHYLTDVVLEQSAKWRCKDLSFSQSLQIHSREKILYVKCLVANFATVCELEKVITSIPQARCFVMHVFLEKTNVGSNDVYKELTKKGICLCNGRVELRDWEAHITGFSSNKDIPESIHKALQKFPIKKIILKIRKRSDIKTIKTINEKDCFIKMSKMGRYIYIDGWVKSESEKKNANFTAFFSSFSFRIKNNLLVIN